MPSHQERREPLPKGYQFGDCGVPPSSPLAVGAGQTGLKITVTGLFNPSLEAFLAYQRTRRSKWWED